jgi:hypothetical protein
LALEQQEAGGTVSTDSSSRPAYVFSGNQPNRSVQSPSRAVVQATAANAASGQYSDLKPYVEVVTEHLKQQKPAGDGSGSGSSGGRGRGAKKAAARSLLESHTAVFQAALDLELQEEWNEAEERLKV